MPMRVTPEYECDNCGKKLDLNSSFLREYVPIPTDYGIKRELYFCDDACRDVHVASLKAEAARLRDEQARQESEHTRQNLMDLLDLFLTANGYVVPEGAEDMRALEKRVWHHIVSRWRKLEEG